MKLQISLLLLVSLFLFNSSAQSQEHFLTIPADNNNLNKIENFGITLLHQFDDLLITKVNEKDLIELSKSGIDFNLLNNISVDENLYLVSGKDEESLRSFLSDYEILIFKKNSAVIKSEEISIEEFLDAELSIKLLNDTSVKFKNESTAFNHNSSIILDDIEQIVGLINSDSVEYFIQSLQDFGTRFCLANNTDEVSNWIRSEFIRMGFTDVKYDSFYYQGIWQKNVVATIEGSASPDDVFVVGGHHDSYSGNDPYTYAPGADDNASGTTAVLEIARTIMQYGYQPESTIKFVTFAAEEYGLHGSDNYAEYALNNNMNIRLMINHDMISHTASSLENSSVDINWYSGFEGFRDIAIQMAETYSVLNAEIGSSNSGGSDSYEFWSRGFPAIYFEESQFSPYYHSDNDVITNYSMEYCAEVIKSSCATLLTVMMTPSTVDDYQLVDLGNGSTLRASWAPNNESDIDGYKIYVGNSSGNYSTDYFTAETYFEITELEEGTEYFVGISAIDNEGNESLIVERSQTPYSIPLPPENFVDEPDFGFITFTWDNNEEYDLLGYNIYRSENSGGNFVKLNSDVITETTFTDDNAENHVYYYYLLKAVDNDLNESNNSEAIRSKVLTMNNGILIVDETIDGDGSLLNPTDEEVDQFYNSLLSNFNHLNFDISDHSNIKLADLGDHSTVLWHGDDLTDITTINSQIEEIQKYLDLGGNFIYCGYKPGFAFSGNNSYPANFESGDFIFDYMKIDYVNYKFLSKFVGAISLQSGYPTIFTDSTKVPESSNYHLSLIETIRASSEGEHVYSYESFYDSTSQQGSMKGLPVGVEYIGNDYKTVVFSFPLYYMEEDKAQILIQNILENKFGEVTSIEENETTTIVDYSLEQNYPNPFNPVTNIRFSIIESGMVSLKVYDILGREVKTLIDQNMNAGFHTIQFNAADLSSGIYLYRLETGNFVDTKKLILLK